MAGSSLIGSLAVSLGLETAAFKRGAQEAVSDMGRLQQRLQGIGQRMASAGALVSASVTAPFAALVTMAMPAAREARQAIGQVEAAQRSMGNAAGFSTEQLQAQAGALMAISTFDDDEILGKVTANLLTFGQVSGAVFERAQRVVVDLSTRMGTDLQASTLMVGKALNAPVEGLTALRRAGIQFTDQQKAQIRAMVEAGDTAGAQSVMLAELERQFGGSAQAMRDATPGADMKNQWDNFLETVGELALNVLPPLTTALTNVLTAFNTLSPETQAFVLGAVAVAAALGPVLLALGGMMSIIAAIAPALAGVVGGFSTFAATLGAASVAAGGLIPALTALIAPVLVPMAAAVAAVVIAWENWGTIGPFVEAVLGGIGQSLGSVMDLLKAVAAVLRGDFSAAWEHVKNFVGNLMTGIGRTVMAVLREIRAALTNFFEWAFGRLDDLENRRAREQRAAGQTLSGAPVPAASPDEMRTVVGRITGRAVLSIAPGMKAAGDAATKAGQAAAKMAQDTQRATGEVINLWEVMAEQTGQTSAQMMDTIHARFDQLGAAMVEPMREAADDTVQAARNMAREMHALLARLFPEIERARDLQRELAMIDADPGLDDATRRRARNRRFAEEGRNGPWTPLAGPGQMLSETGEVIEAEWGPTMDGMADVAERANRSIVASFADMGREVLGSLRSMVSAFKGGDILGGLTGLMEMVLNVAGMIGGTVGKRALSFGSGGVPKWASGGAAIIGGMAGVDRNLLSLNGSPLAWVSRGETLSVAPNMPTPANDGGRFRVEVVPNPYFDVHVTRIAEGVSLPVSAASGIGAIATAERNVFQRVSRTKP